MQLRSEDFSEGGAIPSDYAFAKPAVPVQLAANLNPHLAWSEVPDGTYSFAISCIDSDAPTQADDVNRAGRSVPADLPRTEFVHWLITNIGEEFREIAAGACSEGISVGGKRSPFGPPGSVQGRNDYTAWFANDAEMKGTYLGYDGPCPPWNDVLVHRYQFRIYALDVASLELASGFGLDEFRQALAGHVLAEASLTGRYSLNPAMPA